MNWRRVLVWFLAIGAAVLSFDALRAYALGGHALAGGVIPERTILGREWLAALWAIEIDAMAAAGILGIGMSRRDWRAWAMFLLAAVASLGFQVFTPPVELARAVPPVALFLAIVILEVRVGGAVAVEEKTPREGSTPRPLGPDAGRVAGMAGSSQPSRLAPATPPLSPTPAAEPAAGRPSVGGVSLSDEPRPVTPVATPPTDRGRTVTASNGTPAVPEGVTRPVDQALRRQKANPEEFERVIAKHGLDRDEVMAMARRRNWPVASGNGHRKEVPA